MNRSIRGFNQENIQDMNRTLLLLTFSGRKEFVQEPIWQTYPS